MLLSCLQMKKVQKIEGLFSEIMETLGLDMTDDSLKDSPKRVARCMLMKSLGITS